jgi:hypothetical protein
MQDSWVLVKLDFSNAFNSLHRRAILDAIATRVPHLYRYCYTAYAAPSSLLFGDFEISSEEGIQQGDPLGPLLFCLCLQPILESIIAPLRIGYMDDLTFGGPAPMIAQAVEDIQRLGEPLGLKLNPSKCEIIEGSLAASQSAFHGFIRQEISEATLLGAPIASGKAMDDILHQKCEDLARGMSRLYLLDAHDALILLRAAVGHPTIMNVLRAAPCVDHPALERFDAMLRSGVSKIVNCEISDLAWIQAGLPIRDGGLGVRSVALLAPSAFLASAATTLDLQDAILSEVVQDEDVFVPRVAARWGEMFQSEPLSGKAACSQRSWDAVAIAHGKTALDAHYNDPIDRARLLAVSAPHAGDWLNALPVASCGLRLDDESIRVAVGLRLGCTLCAAHRCCCGAVVDSRGIHGLSCRLAAGRLARHSALNDIIHRAFVSAGIPSVLEPRGLTSSDERRPDGMTMIPWSEGRCLAWDATVSDSLADSHLNRTVHVAGAAAELAADAKIRKYADLSTAFVFVPVAVETLGPICSAGEKLITELGRRIANVSGDPRDTAFLFQRISIAVQRGNAAAVLVPLKLVSDTH